MNDATRHVQDIVGQTVGQIRFDFQLTFITDDDWWIVTEAPMLIDGTRWVPGTSDPVVRSIVAVHRHDLAGFDIGDDGTLTLQFTDTTEIIVPPRPEYDAWSITSPDQRRVICQVGSELALYDPLQPA